MNKFVQALLTAALSVLLVAVTLSVLAPATPIIAAVVVIVIYVVATTLFHTKGMYSVVAVALVGVLIFWKTFLTDTYHFLQQLAIAMANERFIFLQSFEQTSRFDGGLFIAFIALLVVALIWKMVQQKSRVGLLALTVATIGLQLLVRTNADVFVSASFYVVAFIALLYMTSGLMSCVAIIVSSVIVSVFMLTVVGLQLANVTGADVRQSVQLQLDKWRYEYDASQLPNGQLQLATKHSTNEQAALKIVMEEPLAMYVKGFVGTALDGSSWQRLAGERYLQQQPLFVALQQSGFTSAQQFAFAASAFNEQQASHKMLVQNVGADRRYGYVPYETSTIDVTLEANEGATVFANGWRGATTYELTYASTPIQSYPAVANKLYATETSDYLNMESHYNTFVYAHYLQVAEDDRAVLANHFKQQQTNITYEQAIEQVQSFVEKNIAYKEKTEPIASVQQLLEQSKEGYAPHYATLATLLFRTLQIPARYVEGYIVTKEDVNNKAAYSEITVPQRNAHAWTEIYVDMVGWIPIEVTPGFAEKMPAVNTEDYPAFAGASSNVQSELAAGVTQTQQVKDEKIEDEKTTPQSKERELPYWLLLVVIAVIIVATYGYKRLQRRRYLRGTSSNEQAVRHWALLLYMLQREQRVDVEADASFQQAKRIYEKAKYSGQTISNEELSMLLTTAAQLKKVVRKSKKHVHKLPMLWRY